jgi:hypothetical protein
MAEHPAVQLLMTVMNVKVMDLHVVTVMVIMDKLHCLMTVMNVVAMVLLRHVHVLIPQV